MQEMITLNFMITRKHFGIIGYFRKRKGTKKYVKINTWKELEYVTTMDLKLSNHSGT